MPGTAAGGLEMRSIATGTWRKQPRIVSGTKRKDALHMVHVVTQDFLIFLVDVP